jgi:hypothetical protein
VGKPNGSIADGGGNPFNQCSPAVPPAPSRGPGVQMGGCEEVGDRGSYGMMG